MNYRYAITEDNRFDIVETKTGHVIRQNLCRIEAKDMTRALNFGMGFDGWTPAFFMEKITQTGQ